MIKYTIEQKVALLKKLELYKLEHNLSKPKLAKLLKCNHVAINNWEHGKALPKTQLCYQIEKLLLNFTPTLHLENLDGDYIQQCADDNKKRLYKSQNQIK